MKQTIKFDNKPNLLPLAYLFNACACVHTLYEIYLIKPKMKVRARSEV